MHPFFDARHHLLNVRQPLLEVRQPYFGVQHLAVRHSAMQGASPALQGAVPALQGASPALQGASPALQGASPALQGASPALQGASPALQGVEEALPDEWEAPWAGRDAYSVRAASRHCHCWRAQLSFLPDSTPPGSSRPASSRCKPCLPRSGCRGTAPASPQNAWQWCCGVNREGGQRAVVESLAGAAG
jgi:hypothetical protein